MSDAGRAAAEAAGEVAARFPHLHIRSVSTIEAGWDNLVLLVNGSLIFRAPRRPANWRQLETEIRLLPELAPSLPVRVPEFRFVSRGGGRRPIVGYERLNGTPLGHRDTAPPRGPALAREIGAALAALHAFPASRAAELGAPAYSAAEWRGLYRGLGSLFESRIRPRLGAAQRDAGARLWDAFLGEEAHFSFEPSLIHHDLGVEHLLINRSSNRLSGIIDWGDAAVGDPAMDFAGVWDECGPEFTALVMDAYSGSNHSTLLDRAEFYALVAPVHQVLLGLEAGDQAHLKRGMARLAAALDAWP